MKIFFLQRFWPLLSCCCVTAVSSASLSGKYEDALLQQGVSPGSRPLPHDIEHVQDHTKETIPLKRTGHQNLYGTTPEPTDTAPAQVDIEEEFGPAAQHSGRPSPPWDAPGGPPVRPAWLLALGLAAVLLLLLAGLCPLLWWLQRGGRTKSSGLFFQPLEPLQQTSPQATAKHIICQSLEGPPFNCVDSAVQQETTTAFCTSSIARGSSLSETDSDQGFSPTRSPLRTRTRGLLERRGSNASLTLDLNKASQGARGSSSVKDRGADPYLRRAGRRLSRTHLRASLNNVSALHSEFWDIPLNHPERVEIPGCGTKNRYRTILPNEQSRVRLRGTSQPDGEYINANYIEGYGGVPKAFIATQGPLAHTVPDFWAMVWQERAPVIVMITNLVEDAKIKCEQYLPEEKATFAGIQVDVVRVTCCDGYTLRELRLQKGPEEVPRRVMHLWYTAWPDHKAPESPQQLLGLVLEVERLRTKNKGPVVVHCSAGIGRTGCFVASSIGVRQLLEENSVDVLGIVCSLRRDRGGMVQTAEQYEFVHRTLCLFERDLAPKKFHQSLEAP